MTFDVRRLNDPQFIHENRMDPHADFRAFPNREAAEVQGADGATKNEASNGFVTSLDGQWKFQLAETPTAMPAPISSAEAVDRWGSITVPGHIQLQGHDRPQYVNTQYPWDGMQEAQWPSAPADFNPVGCYVRTFDAPQLSEGERLVIRFDGAESALALWLNGDYVGFATDTFTPSEFDITDLVKAGPNVLDARVFKWWAGSWLEDQDFFRFSGLFRSVSLVVLPATRVRDFKVVTDVSEDLTEATVEVTLASEGDGAITVDLAGVGPLTQSEPGKWAIQLENPRLWSPEDPHLYQLQIEVKNSGGEVTQFVTQAVGIRRFAIEDGMLKLNGQRVVFNGVNRHEFGVNGRVMTAEQTEKDLIALKRIGINAVRTSHYPNNSFFYDLADKYGLMVIDEANLESHGLWDRLWLLNAPVEEAVPGDDPQWLPTLLDRAQNMYERDKNHPSIVMWSCGNESFGGKDILVMSDYFRSVDNRPVHYEGARWDGRYPETSDVVTQMYTPAAEVEEYLQKHRDKPLILCEYAHAMGNSFGAVDKYVELAYREPLYQGGFIWDFSDQALPLVDRHGQEYFGYGGDFGDRPHDGDFSGNGIFFADHTPKPFVQEVAFVYRPLKVEVSSDQFTVENRFLFTDAEEFECVVSVAREGDLVATQAISIAVAPGETKSFPLPVAIPAEPGEYAVEVSFRTTKDTLWATAGHEVAFGQGVITRQASEPLESPAPIGADFRVVQGIRNVGAHGVDEQGGEFSILFSRLYGGLVSYRYRGVEMLDKAPVPNFWHAPTSNERGWKAHVADGQWLLASRYPLFDGSTENPLVEVTEGGVSLRYRYDLPTTPASACQLTYQVDSTGRVEVELEVAQAEGLGDMPELGMLFAMSADFDHLTWYGEGPEESYQDRRLGARLGVYESKVVDQFAKYLKPQETGNHTEVRWANVTDASGLGLRFEGNRVMEFSALPWSPFEVENAAHPNELPPIVRTYVRPALQRRGVAGDDSWGSAVHPEFTLPKGTLTFRFAFKGVS